MVNKDSPLLFIHLKNLAIILWNRREKRKNIPKAAIDTRRPGQHQREPLIFMREKFAYRNEQYMRKTYIFTEFP